MAITSAEAVVRHSAPMPPGGFPGPTKGRLVMLTVMFGLFAVALAFPGLITVIMSCAIDAQ